MKRIRTPFTLALLLALAWPGGADAQFGPSSGAELKASYAATVKRTTPAVVNIYARQIVRQQAMSPLMNDPFFQRFFEGSPFAFGIPQERVENSLGSGVVVRADGVIVTNNHVIEGASEITVAFPDRREMPARVLLTDPKTDIAVLKVDPAGKSLPSLALADSDVTEVGDVVLAIGNPFGVGQTVTQGIVSALARTQVGVSDYQFFIQTDAAINPGNSGGALVTSDGRLIGINTAIYSRSGGSIGIGFAIPANMVKLVVDSAVSGGQVVRPWLGAQGQPVTAEIAGSLGLDRPGGVLVNKLHPDGPASKAGIKIGDVITGVDGFDVADPQSLQFRIATRKVGGSAELTLRRGGAERAVKVELTRAPEDPPRTLTAVSGRNPLAGATIGNLSPAFAEELGLDSTARGVVITAVAAGSPAQNLRLRPGDMVLALQGQEISSVAQCLALVKNPQAKWQVTLKRNDQVLNVMVQG